MPTQAYAGQGQGADLQQTGVSRLTGVSSKR